MKRIAPGVYDDNGEMHIAMDELLADAGFEDTPENRATCIAAWQDLCAAEGIEFLEVDP